MIEQRVTLRYGAQQIPAIVQAVQGDTGRDVIFELADYEIPAGATANYYIDKPDDTAIYNSAEVISSTEILAHLTEQALAAPGRNNGQVRILSDGEVITSFDFVLEVEAFRGILRLQSETEVNIFDEALQAAAEDAIAEIQEQTPVVTGMQNSIAPSYSASSTYNVGDYVMYNAQLYRCITAITTEEAWTATHWTQVPLANDVNVLKADLTQTNYIYPYSKNTGYINATGGIGAAGTSTKEEYTSKIPVETGDYVSFVEKHPVSHSLWCAYALYDETETFISRVSLTNNNETDYFSATVEITNTSAKYIAFTYRSYGDASVTIFNGFLTELEDVKKSALKVLGSINSTSDLNDLKEAGFYITGYNNLPLHSPANVRQGVAVIMPDSATAIYPFINQTFIDIYSGIVYTRSKGGGASGTWGDWKTKVWYTSLGSLTSVDDMNNLTKEGYYITGYNNNPAHSPENVRQGFVVVMPDSTSNANPFTCQMFVDIYTGTLYVRAKGGGRSGTWGTWQTKNIYLVWNEAKNSTLIGTYMESNSSSVSVNGDRVRVLSYNVAHYNNDTQTYIDTLPEKLCNLKKLLMFVHADVLSIPEDDEYIDNSDEKDSTAWIYKPIYPFKVGGGSCCVHSKTTFIDSQNITLPGGWTIRRGDISVGSKTLSVYSVHLTVLSEEDRATELSQIFSQIATDNPDYYVIAGDMNCIEEGEKETFKATCESHGCTLANGGYLGWLNTHKNNLALDNIVVSNNIIIENTEVLGNWYEGLYSDHYPIFCDLVLLDV